MKAALAVAVFVLLLCGAAARAAEPDALTVARKCDAALKGKSQHGTASMTVRTPEWQRTLVMTFWYDYPEKTFIRITAPAKDAGTGTLRLGSSMWTYLPMVERVIKIPPSLMLQSWMGSDFTNDDLVKESSLPIDYTHRIEGETVEDGDPCYRLVATPKPDAAVVWGKLVLLIRKSDFLPRREEYYDEHGALIKDPVFRPNPHHRHAQLPHALAHDLSQQAGTRNHADFLGAGIRQARARGHLHAAEPAAAFLRSNDAFLANGVAQRLAVSSAISAHGAYHCARADVQHPDAGHRRRLSRTDGRQFGAR